ncbi:hypothetical protein [Clostridium thailandense]|uniref:hypothetical protein n=1 Tax=Clostridium thailandense TaxID=2794346 RepID=UPI00398A4FB9
MKPLSLEDIFAVYEPLTYIFPGTGSQTLNKKIAAVTVEKPCEDCLSMELQFNGILISSANFDADVILNFTVFKVSQDVQPELLTTFVIQQQFNSKNLTNYESIMFQHTIPVELVTNLTHFRLELTNIIVTVASSVEIGISGTILGLVIPN